MSRTPRAARLAVVTLALSTTLAGASCGDLSASWLSLVTNDETPDVAASGFLLGAEPSCEVQPDLAAPGEQLTIYAAGMPRKADVVFVVTDGTGTELERITTRSDRAGRASVPVVAGPLGTTDVRVSATGGNGAKDSLSAQRAATSCEIPIRCGDDRCEGGEDCGTCESDCGRCGSTSSDASGTPPHSAVERHGALHIQGSQMVDENDSPVQLKGMSLFWHNWMGKYYNAGVVETLAKEWGSSVIRAAIGVEPGSAYLEDPSDAIAKMRAVVDAAIANGIYVIVDWHAHDIHTEEAKGFFRQVASEYGEYPNIIYEIFNEPDDESWSDIKAYALEVIEVIRHIDPDNIIVVGTPQWSQEVHRAAADPIQSYQNIAYSLHFYAGTHTEWLRTRARDAIANGIPVFVTEWGASAADGGANGEIYLDEADEWVDFMNDKRISWCNWSIADKRESSAALRPDAGVGGDWSSADLTPSGAYVRSKIADSAPTCGDGLCEGGEDCGTCESDCGPCGPDTAGGGSDPGGVLPGGEPTACSAADITLVISSNSNAWWQQISTSDVALSALGFTTNDASWEMQEQYYGWTSNHYVPFGTPVRLTAEISELKTYASGEVAWTDGGHVTLVCVGACDSQCDGAANDGADDTPPGGGSSQDSGSGGEDTAGGGSDPGGVLPGAEPGDELKIAVLSVGPADSTLIVFPTTKTMLVDSASPWSFDERVVPFLERQGVTHLDYYVETHPHSDHIAGRDFLIEEGYVDDETVRWDWNTHDYEDEFVLEGTNIFISNAYDAALNGSGVNNNSLAFRLEYNGFVYSHGGDEYTGSMSRYLEEHPTIAKCHVRNTAHHMYGPVEKDYLVAIDPYLFIISNDSSIRQRDYFQGEFLPAIETLEADPGSRYQEYLILGELGHAVIRASSDTAWGYQSYPDSDLVPDFP